MMAKVALMLLLAAFLAFAVYLIGLALYKLYRIVKRENNLDAAYLDDAAAQIEHERKLLAREHEQVKQTLRKVRKSR